MLTCDEAKRALPGLATGETPTHALREHLATCDDCRAVRDATAIEVETLREGFASLSPSPFLEEAVLDAAQRGAEDTRSRRPWAYVATAAVAAAALFLVVILPQLEDSSSETVVVDGPPGDGDDARPAGPGVEVSPSVGQVEAARTLNAASTDLGDWPLTPGEMLHKGATPKGDFGLVNSSFFLPASDGVHHRYVYGDEDAQPGNRVVRIGDWTLEPGLIVLGTDLLAEIGGELVETRGKTVVAVGDRRWTMTPGTTEGEIRLASPNAQHGTKARVRVLVSTAYSGSLLIEGPLARALGLHQFEIPGDVRFHVGPDEVEGGPIGRRARARVSIPELGFDRVVEVQTVRDRPWQVKRGDSDDPIVAVEGAVPSSVMWARTLSVDRTGLTASGGVTLHQVRFDGEAPYAVPLGQGAWQVAVTFAHSPSVPRIPDEPVLGELFTKHTSTALLRALDSPPWARHAIEARRVKLGGTWEAGADVLIARAWRGMRAVPSREAVVLTKVRPDGTISFVRVAGEPGSTLRMLVTRADGTSTFHEVVVSPDPVTTTRIPVSVFASGVVKLPGWETRVMAPAGAELLPPEETMKALVGLRDHLRDMAGPRDESGFSAAELSLHVEPRTRWQLVQWVLQIAAEPTIRLVEIALAPANEPQHAQRIRLPADGDLDPFGVLDEPKLVVKLFRRGPDDPLRIRAANESATTEDLASRLRTWIGKTGIEPVEIVGELRTPRPGGLGVQFQDALMVIRTFREVGIGDVRIEGTPAPMPR